MLIEQIQKLVEANIAGTSIFLVDVKVSPSKIRVFIDNPEGIKIEKCIELSRFLREKLEGNNVLEYHELEVSSPGLDEPLKVVQQYEKAKGREISVITFDGIKHIGILESVTVDGIVLNESILKKENGKTEKKVQQFQFPFSQIKETRVVISFGKIVK